MSKISIISGITGQGGAYLSQLLLDKGHHVIGLTRSVSSSSFRGLNYLGVYKKITIVECDLLDISQIIRILNQYQPNEIYNLAAQSSVSLSFKQPIGTFQFNTLSVFNFIEAIRIVNNNIKFYQASSSEMYGIVNKLPITEDSVFHPTSPYAISKAAAHWACINYRESYNLFICCGVLFNHDSYLRSDNFFIKKVIRESIQIKNKLQDKLVVGNIDIKRDFGYAPKYVEAMYLMMQQTVPKDYLVCCGESVSLRNIIEYVFERLHINIDKCEVSEKLFRPSEINNIYGNNHKIKEEIGWKYDYSFFDVLDILIEEELRNFQ